MARRQKVRPEGWSPESALEIARNGKVKRELTILATQIGLGWRTLYADIHTWRKNDPEFEEQWTSLMAQFAPVHTGYGGRSAVVTTELKEKFIEEFSENASKVKSATACGVSWSHIYNILRPGHRSYDEKFAKAVAQVERNIIGEMEDTVVETVRSTDDDRTKLFGAFKFLERKDPENWGKMVEMKHSGEVKHDHDHKVQITAAETRAILEKDFARFLPKPEEEEDVVEGEVVAVD